MSRLTAKELGLIRRQRAATQGHAAAPAHSTGLLASAVGAVKQALQRRRTIAELSRLDNHLLRDIGLERGNLESVAEALTAGDDVRAAAVNDLMSRLHRWSMKRATIRELEGLDDRSLAVKHLAKEQGKLSTQPPVSPDEFGCGLEDEVAVLVAALKDFLG